MFRSIVDVKPLLRGETGWSFLFCRRCSTSLPNTPNALRGVSQAIEGGPYLRKAPCQFGWDWGPQLPPIGVWKDIRLEGRSGARMADAIRQHHGDDG